MISSRGLQAVGLGVEVAEAGAQPANRPPPLEPGLDSLERLDQDLLQFDLAAGFLLFEDGENLLFGLVEKVFGLEVSS